MIDYDHSLASITDQCFCRLSIQHRAYATYILFFRVVFEAEASGGGSKQVVSPILPFPFSLASPFPFPLSFQIN